MDINPDFKPEDNGANMNAAKRYRIQLQGRLMFGADSLSAVSAETTPEDVPKTALNRSLLPYATLASFHTRRCGIPML